MKLNQLVGRHEERLDEHDERIDELRAAQAEAERKFAALAEALTRLADSQAHSDQRLDALIDIVQNRLDRKSET